MTDGKMEFKKPHLLMLCCTAYFAMAGGALLAPALPEMTVPLHTTMAEIGLLMSVYTISTAMFTLVIGHFIDRVSRRSIIVPCLMIYGLTGLACFFVTDFTTLLALRFVQGIGVAGMMTLTLLIIGDVYRGHESVQAISKISITFALGAISAPLIGGVLAMPGWNVPFLFYALSLPFAIVMLASLTETGNRARGGSHRGIGDAIAALRDVRIAYTVFLGFAVYFLLFAMVIYVPFELKNMFGFTSGQSGLVLALEGVATVLMASRVGFLTGRYSMVTVITAGLALLGVSMAFMAIVPSVPAIIFLLVLFGAGYGLAQTTVDVLMIRITSQESRGGILSVHSCAKYTGQSLAPIVLGLVLAGSGLTAVFVLAGMIGLLMAAMTYGMIGRFEVAEGAPLPSAA